MEKMNDRLKRLRKEKGVTQDEVAKVTKISRSNIAKYENGIVDNMKTSTIKVLADYYGVTPSYLLCFKDEIDLPEINYEIELEKLGIKSSDLHSLTPEAKKEIKSFVDFIKTKYGKD